MKFFRSVFDFVISPNSWWVMALILVISSYFGGRTVMGDVWIIALMLFYFLDSIKERLEDK